MTRTTQAYALRMLGVWRRRCMHQQVQAIKYRLAWLSARSRAQRWRREAERCRQETDALLRLFPDPPA